MTGLDMIADFLALSGRERSVRSAFVGKADIPKCARHVR
jgi:hypothetical protein